MDDLKMLEMAGRAAGLPWYDDGLPSEWLVFDETPNPDIARRWNALTNDGDALRVAVKLRLEVRIEDYGTSVRAPGKTWFGCEAHVHGGIEAATRRAIVRAAADIGKAL